MDSLQGAGLGNGCAALWSAKPSGKFSRFEAVGARWWKLRSAILLCAAMVLVSTLAASARNRGLRVHPSSVPVSREHRHRLDTELLKRAFLGWLRGEPKHCSMAAIPTLADAKGPGRERQSLVGERIRIINRLKANLARLAFAEPGSGIEPAGGLTHAGARGRSGEHAGRTAARPPALHQAADQGDRDNPYQALGASAQRATPCDSRLLARVVGVGIEIADMLVQEVFSRNIWDRKALARHASLTGAPDESGKSEDSPKRAMPACAAG